MDVADSSPTPSGLSLEVVPEFRRIVGIVRFAECFRKFQFVLVNNVLVQKTAAIQSNLFRWRQSTTPEPNFQGGYEKFVVGHGKLGARKTLQF